MSGPVRNAAYWLPSQLRPKFLTELQDKAAGYQEVRRLRGAVNLHALLRRKLKLSRPLTDGALKGLKYVVNPRQARLRRAAVHGLTPASAIGEAGGYMTFGSDAFPGLGDVVADCRDVFETLRAGGELERLRREAKKDFLISIVRGTEFARHPRTMNFMISRPIIDQAIAYMDAVPVLAAARLWWTPANSSQTGSQLYHRDGEDSRQIKVFVNILEVAADCGPFTLLPADVSAEVKAITRYYSGRLTDETVAATGLAGRAVALTGPAGSGAFVDTSRCLHYGSRGNARDRLVLMFQFTSFLAPKAEDPSWAPALAHSELELDALQKLALNLR